MKKIIAFIVSIVILSACGSKDKKAQLEKLRKDHDKISTEIAKLEKELGLDTAKQVSKKVLITVTELKSDTFSHYIEVQGKLDGDENVAVSPQMSGVVKQVFVKEGASVSKGQVLASLEDATLQKTLNELKSQLEFAVNLYNKQKTLWDKKIGSEVQYLTAKNNKESLENKIITLKEQMDLTKVKSPINGTVEEVGLKIGQMAAPGVLPAFRVVNFSKIKVVADVAEAYATKIQKGDDVLIHFPDVNKEVRTKVDFTSKYINPTNRTFSVEMRFPSGSIPFKANMLSVVKIKDYSTKKAITVPLNVLQTDSKGSFVFTAETLNNKLVAKKRTVKSGQSYRGVVEILEGLKEGDKIISSGYQGLEEGEEVKL